MKIDKFDCEIYYLWKVKMEDVLMDKDEWIMVDPYSKPKKNVR